MKPALRPAWQRYTFAIASVLAASAIRQYVLPATTETPMMLFLAAVMVSAWFGGLRAGLLATLLSAMVLSYWFLPPYRSWYVTSFSGQVRITVFVAVALVIGWLTESLRIARGRAEANEQAALERREALRVTLASIGDAVITTDTTGCITYLNPMAESLTGWSVEALGLPLEKVFRIIHEETREPLDAPSQQSLREGAVVARSNQTLLIAKDGREHPIDDTAAPIINAQRQVTGVVLVFRDTAERRRHERAQRERHRLAALNAEIGSALTHATDLSTMLQLCCESIVRHLEGAFARVWTLNEAEQVLELQASAGMYTHLGGEHSRIPVGMYKIGWIAENRRPHLTNRVLGDERVADQKWAQREGMVAFAGYPLLVDDTLLGVVAMFARQPLSHATLDAFQSIAANVAVGIQRRRAERELQQQRQWLKAVLDLMPQPFLFVEPGTARLLFANRAANELAEGAFSKERLGEPYPSFYHCTDSSGQAIPEDQHPGWRVARGERLEAFEMDWHLNDRVVPLWLHADTLPAMFGQPAMCVVVFQDVSRLKQIENQLREQQQLLRTVTDNATAALFVIDARGYCTYMNPAAVQMIGFQADEVRSQTLHDLIHHTHPDGRPYPRSDCPLECALFERSDIRAHADVFIRKNGQFFPVVCAASPIFEQDRPTSTVIEVRDVTEEKANRDALQEANRRKDEFLAILAHELRNPLTPLSNGIELLGLVRDDPQQVEQLCGMMSRQVKQMVRLIDDLLDVSRISRGKIELRRKLVPLSEIIAIAVEGVQPLCEERGHTLTINPSPQPIRLDADPARLSQVVMNLLINACKYTPPGGHISLTTERFGSDALIRVQDNGLGLPSERLHEIFEMFCQLESTLDSSRSGLGLGLTLVKNLVEMHGGRITADSAGPGQGSEFVVHLPVWIESESGVAEPASALEVRPTVPRRVLVVEDMRAIAQVFAMLLSKLGHEVCIAADGAQGLEQVGRFHPDVIFSDISMPGMSGYELAQRIRRQREWDAVVLVAMTGYGQEDDRRRALEAGFDHHMVKPADLEVLQSFFASLAERANS